jgi:hypothetical protein
MTCSHPERRSRVVVVRGCVTRQPYCKVCHADAQRARRALKRAFRQLATLRWAHG